MTSDLLPCWIYRSPRQAEMYLYLPDEAAFEALPSGLLERFGAPQFVMQLNLHPGRLLAREDVGRVMRNLREHGFHLQLPPKLTPDLYEGD